MINGTGYIRWGRSRSRGPYSIGVGVMLLYFAGNYALAETPEASRTVSFAEGKWDPSQWQVVRMVNQQEARTFTQNADSLGMTMASYQKGDYGKERDNALLVTDTGTTEGQIEVTFRLGEGFNKTSSPGILLSPVIVDGVMERGIGVFVATYAMAVWLEDHDASKTRVTYAHLAHLSRWNDPEKKHVLRCRYSKKQKSIALQIDDSDVLVFQFVGHPKLGKVDLEVNSLIGIWGCHGVCEFYEMGITRGGSLPFFTRTKPESE